MELSAGVLWLLAAPYVLAAAALVKWWLAAAPRAEPAAAAGKYSAALEGDFCVFVIGLYINPRSWWGRWRTVLRAGAAVDAIKRELAAQPELGCLLVEHTNAFLGSNPTRLVQIWRSYDHLASYARNRMGKHLGAWLEWDAAAKGFKGGQVPGVGIYHEAFIVRPGEYEAVYRNMPPTGLARVGRIVSASEGRMRTGRGRLGRTDGGDHAGVGYAT